jgi:hypothetical protein
MLAIFEKERNLFYIYVVISLIVITILIALLQNKKKNEGFCNCFGMQTPAEKTCPDPDLLKALYNSGELTEFTDLDKGRKPEWKNLLQPTYQPYNQPTKSCCQ